MAERTDARPLALFPRGDEPSPMAFRRGSREPYGIRWFGSTALLGHLRHLTAERLATGQIDTRDWMRAQPPAGLLREVARVLEAQGEGDTLVERLGRDVWIDFVADTGDDSEVSAAVAGMVFAEYELQDGSGRVLPRGDLLIFGGDTAYPLSSAPEIARRLTHPWNQVLARLSPPARARAMLAIPGNHDWYDGLDGFARLFRRDPLRERADRGDDPELVEQLRRADSADPTESGRALGRNLPPAPSRRDRRFRQARRTSAGRGLRGADRPQGEAHLPAVADWLPCGAGGVGTGCCRWHPGSTSGALTATCAASISGSACSLTSAGPVSAGLAASWFRRTRPLRWEKPTPPVSRS